MKLADLPRVTELQQFIKKMTTIFFIFTNIILLFKLTLLIFFKLFLISNPFGRYILLFFCFFIIYLLYKYPRTRFKKLSQARNYKYNKLMKYKLKNKFEHIYNIFVIITFVIFMFLCIFLLRYSNKDKAIDLVSKYLELKALYQTTSLDDFLFNAIILLLLFIIYLWCFLRIVKYFKYHVIKRHILLIGNVESYNIYHRIIFDKIMSNITISQIHFKIVWAIHNYFEMLYYVKFNEKKSLDNFTVNLELYNKIKIYYDQFFINPLTFFKLSQNDVFYFFLTKWHYILLLSLLVYDLFFNNLQITHVFYVLPWTFFFEVYLRLGTFIDGLWTPHDQYLHTILYANSIEIWDKNTLLINGEFYDYNHAKIIYKTYVERDFVKDSKNL